MRVVHLQDFGLHKAGDIVVVPDGSEVSPLYFAEVDDDGRLVDNTPLPAAATDRARGLEEPARGDEGTPNAESGKATTPRTTRKGKG